ncbi:MAG: hypothetical protein ACI9VT_003875 [Psychroserpens sp.]|jgi:hypothetical protein
MLNKFILVLSLMVARLAFMSAAFAGHHNEGDHGMKKKLSMWPLKMVLSTLWLQQLKRLGWYWCIYIVMPVLFCLTLLQNLM